jgi:hypothetical protein
MAHDIVIIITRIQALKGQTNTEASGLETMRLNAVAANQWLIDNPGQNTGKRRTVHEYLEAMQSMLGEQVADVEQCNAAYPL